jgi:hypothetical protein
MIQRAVLLTIVSLIVFSTTSTFAAIQTYFGEDLMKGAGLPLPSYPNAAAAEAEFLSKLVGVGTETFEALSEGATRILSLNFLGAGTATLDVGIGKVISLPQGQATTDGRYGITNDRGPEKFLDVEAGGRGPFFINFSQPIAAFGFYGIDIGDFSGELRLQTNTGLLSVPHTASRRAEGAVLFFGFIATTAAETVSSIAFRTSTGAGDYFGFDDLTIASLQQVQSRAQPQNQQRSLPPTKANPEPASLLLWGTLIAFVGLLADVRKRCEIDVGNSS